jgi:Uma2 family endonuclease
MSPESLETHNYIKADVALVVHGLILRRDLGRFIADRALFTNEAASISTEPDSMFVSRQSLRTGRCVLVESSRPGVSIEVTGSPDWILEVVSPTSVRKDKTILRGAYFRAGVAEYWLIDALGDNVEFEILVPGQNEFVAVAAQNGWLASPTFGCSFRLTRKKDEDGFWLYTLHVQEN